MPMEVVQFLHAKNVNPVRVHNVAMAAEWTKALATGAAKRRHGEEQGVEAGLWV
jgi:hypothetical protein